MNILTSRKILVKLTHIAFMGSGGPAFGEDTSNKLPSDTHLSLAIPMQNSQLGLSLIKSRKQSTSWEYFLYI